MAKMLAEGMKILFALLVVLGGLVVWSRTEWLIDLRAKRIDAEIATLGAAQPWAGTYERGPEYARERLCLAPGAGFQYTLRSKFGARDWQHGAIEPEASLLRLRPQVLGIATSPIHEYQIVDWGPRRYLIEPELLDSFTNGVNLRRDGVPDRAWSYYLRVGDEQKPVHGLPSLPEEFARHLLLSPFEGHIARVLEIHPTRSNPRQRVAEIEIDRGRAEHAFDGMWLRCEVGQHWDYVFVSTADEHTSRAELQLESHDPDPEAGWVVYTTREP
jgi:hypothetical protein